MPPSLRAPSASFSFALARVLHLILIDTSPDAALSTPAASTAVTTYVAVEMLPGTLSEWLMLVTVAIRAPFR